MTEQPKVQLTPEQIAEIKYATIMQRIAVNVAKAQITGKPNPEQGASIVSRNVTALNDEIIRKFSGVLGLGDLMAILGTIAGQAVVVAAMHGAKIGPAMLPEMADLFYAGIKRALMSNNITLDAPKIVKA